MVFDGGHIRLVDFLEVVLVVIVLIFIWEEFEVQGRAKYVLKVIFHIEELIDFIVRGRGSLFVFFRPAKNIDFQWRIFPKHPLEVIETVAVSKGVGKLKILALEFGDGSDEDLIYGWAGIEIEVVDFEGLSKNKKWRKGA